MFSILASADHSRWLDKAAKACYDSDEEFRVCPSADCSWGCLFSTKDDGNIFKCQLCKYRHCTTCDVPMHEDETCEEYKGHMAAESERKRLQDDQNSASERKVDKISKPCPKCTTRLDKYDGCDHVTCMLTPMMRVQTNR